MTLATLACALVGAARAGDEALSEEELARRAEIYLREHYTKYEYRIAMRDGVALLTSVYAPKDTSQPYPILLHRTPYGSHPYGVDNYMRPVGGIFLHYAREKFIFVMQDVRGRYGSDGEFVHMRPIKSHKAGPRDTDESTDTYDTIDWLVRNVANNNGRVGLLGISYLGFYSAVGLVNPHPALKCVSPQAPAADWFVGDDFRHNGALYLAHTFNFFAGFGHRRPDAMRVDKPRYPWPTPDGYDFFLRAGPLERVSGTLLAGDGDFWDELIAHETYDEFWRARNLLPHLKNVTPAVMTVGGWFDAEDLYGPLGVYRQIERTSPRAFNVLVMGPWSHGEWAWTEGRKLGDVDFQAPTAAFYREHIELPFLKHFLKDDPRKAKLPLPEAFVFETGTNQWRRHDAWPPREAQQKILHLGSGGRLAFEPLQDNGVGFDEYVSDPAKPVPYVSYTTNRMTKEHMVDDQRFAARRPDVLVYQTDVLEHDVTLAGPITASLRVSTTGTDSDWIVKLIDVYPGDFPDPQPNPTNVRMGGYQQLVRGEVMRGKFRNSLERPEPFAPGEPAHVEYALPDVFHTFRRGHRIMVHVQSSWFPLVDRNPQVFMEVPRAQPGDFRKATQRVYYKPAKQGSTLQINVLPSSP